MGLELEKLYRRGQVMPLVYATRKVVHWHRCPVHEGWFTCGDPLALCDQMVELWCMSCILKHPG